MTSADCASLRRAGLVIAVAGAVAGAVWAAPPSVRSGPAGLDRTIDSLGLSPEQKQAADSIVQQYHRDEQAARDSFLQKMQATLTPEQYDKLESEMNRPAPGQRRPMRENNPPTRPATVQPATVQPATVQLPDGSLQVPVTLTGGYETDRRDGGRPVVLIAAGLNVPSEVFRKAFTGVTPAHTGGGPDDAQARRNKNVLMTALGPYGVTDDRLNEVSNYYRYAGSKGEMWRNRPAVVSAHVVNGAVAEFTITDAGAGFTSPPEVSIAGMPDVKAKVTLSYGTDLPTNGSIKSITLQK